MKKFVVLFFLVFATATLAQNFQLHYDLGEDRKYITSTIEMFKPDKFGATFFFVDFDYNATGNKTMSLAYFEIARYFSIPGVEKLSATVQYNDGTAPWGRLGSIWLGGASYAFDLSIGSVSVDILYRKDYLSLTSSNVQGTVVWFLPFLDGKLTLTGFLDVWTGEYWYSGGSTVVLLTEPQIWYNVWENLNLGGEVEISNNFLPGTDGFQFKPTLGFKWVF